MNRIIEYLIILIFIVSLNFFIPRLMPGDPFTYLSSDAASEITTFSDEQLRKYKSYYELDRPIHIQYISYIKNLSKGYLGFSIIMNDDVAKIVTERAKWTIWIILLSTSIGAMTGCILGCFSAYKKNTIIDQTMYLFFIFLNEIPMFLIGILFVFILCANWNLFPLSGGMTSFAEYDTYFDLFKDVAYHAMLPIITLAIGNIGGFYLLSRNSVMLVLEKDYMITAKAKGLNEKRILYYHALKNAILPIVTRIFMNFGHVVGGTILIENVFQYPGLGTLMREAVVNRDYPLIQGVFLFLAIGVMLTNLISDIVCKKLDPRLR